MIIATAASGLSEAKTWVDIIGGAITALAVLIGAAWAYFKFVAGRTFRPRLETTLLGEWRDIDGEALLHVCILLKNIGAAKVKLIQAGSGLRASRLSTGGNSSPVAMSWNKIGVFEIFTDHEWVEPSELIHDEHLLDLGVPSRQLLLLESRLVLKRRRPFKNVVVMSRRILPTDSIMHESAQTHTAI